jgi:hypothetical protein
VNDWVFLCFVLAAVVLVWLIGHLVTAWWRS